MARRLDRVEVLLCDVVKDALPCDGVDVVLCLFVLSSIAPGALPGVVQKLGAALKPGGRLLFRDYGRYDAAQLRSGRARKSATTGTSRRMEHPVSTSIWKTFPRCLPGSTSSI